MEENVKQGLSSIEVSKNSKGYTWSCKIYAKSNEKNDIQESISTLVETEATLKKQYGGENV